MIRMNRGFAARWKAGSLEVALPGITLQRRVAELVQAPFIRREGALLLEPLAQTVPGLRAFEDVTGLEAFLNKVHLEDLIGASGSREERLRVLMEQGAKSALVLSERLEREGDYRVLLSIDPDAPRAPAVTMRFFGRREGIPWGAEDPDEYELEEVLVIDTE